MKVTQNEINGDTASELEERISKELSLFIINFEDEILEKKCNNLKIVIYIS